MDHLFHRVSFVALSRRRIGKAFKEMTEARNRILDEPNVMENETPETTTTEFCRRQK